MRKVVFVVLASCGRIGFDPSNRGGALGDAPRDDARPADAGIDSPPLACMTTNLPCTGTALVAPCGSTCFATCFDAVDQATAAAKCASWPGTLARLDSNADQLCAAGIANDAWIGFVQDPTATTPTTGWKWTVGGPATFVNWLPSDPDDQDGIEDGAAQCTISSSGGWLDEPCNAAKITLCSRPK